MGAPKNHPRYPLRLYGISRKKREERDVKIQIELEKLEKRGEERVIQVDISGHPPFLAGSK